MGITSTGSGKAPSRSTSLPSSMMQTNRRDAAATIFSRVSAAPPPLISMPLRVASSAPSTYRSSSPTAFKSSCAMPVDSSRSDVWRELETTPRSRIFRAFSTSTNSPTVEPVPTPSSMPSST